MFFTVIRAIGISTVGTVVSLPEYWDEILPAGSAFYEADLVEVSKVS
jgi:hypothetical protein